MANIKLVLLIFSIFGFIMSTSFYYMPERLTYTRSASDYMHLYDPEIFLKYQHFDEIQKIITNIKNNRNFEVLIYVFSYIDTKYGLDKDKDISWFSNDLSYLKFQGDEKRDDNSIILIIAIGDRQSRIRTGKNSREYLQDKKCTEYLDSVKSLLKSELYSDAVLEIMKKIETRILDNYQYLSDFYSWLWDLLFNGFVILIFAICCYIFIRFTEKRISKSAQDQLEKIKKITKNGKPRKQILQQVCVICLDDIEQNNEEVHTNLNNDLSGNAPSVGKIEINQEKKQNEEEDTKINNKKDDNFIAKLECGHIYHSKCLSEWMTKNNQCPVCKEKIDKEDNDDHPLKPNNTSTNINQSTLSEISMEYFLRSLLNIQTSMHPELSSLDYTISSNNFSWARQESSSKSSYDFKWGSGGGGGSSKW